MPRLVNAVPRYRKHRASGQAICELNGRRYYLGPHGSKASKIEYDRLITEWLASGRSVSYGVPTQQRSIAEMLAAYLAYAKSYYGAGPRTEYREAVRAVRPLNKLYGRQPTAEFDGQKLKAVRQQFIDDGHCRKYVNQNIQRLVRVFRWAAGEGLVPADVPVALGMVSGLRRGKTTAPEGKKVLPVAAELVTATLPRLSTPLRAMVELQQLTGMRPGEVVILRPCDVDRSEEVWRYVPSRHKTENHDKSRTVYIGPQAQHVLRPFLLRGAEDYCFSPAESVAEMRAARTEARKTSQSCGNTVGSNRIRHKPGRQAGKCYTTQSYGRAIQRACDEAFQIPDELADDEAAAKEWRDAHRWAPNQLRHLAGTEIRKQFGLEAAQVTLGHIKADVTQIYAERDAALAAKVAKQIG